MGVKWTDEQQKVIDLRDRNLLVSAAAGSGKTAVLVERIIQKITDKNNPVDIDKILVVTFTKAAAAEMRERISLAIERLREENPDDENLLRQSTLINNAHISTIDSFCLFVVRNHFGEINLDPNFRIADPGEIKLLEQDVLNECFELNYQADDNQMFLNLVDLYSASRSDDKVKDMVMKIYHISQSDSWPKKWIGNLVNSYNISSEDELLETPIVLGITSYVKSILLDYKNSLLSLKEIAADPDGPDKYLPTIEGDIGIFDGVDEISDYRQLYEFFDSFKMGNLPPIRDKNMSPLQEENKGRVQDGRNKIKKEIDEIRKSYFAAGLPSLIEQLNRLAPIVNELVRLSLMYTDMVVEKKREKRIADFNDIEHFALRIFMDEESGCYTDTAREFRNHFEEIMIDEYQDSNQIQEDILCSISQMEDGHHNMFMVGDVKQSIYRFRLARPELFMNKYNTYDLSDSKTQRIDLHKNFRSRQEVLDFTNDIFYKLMQRDIGGVAYSTDAALYLGASYPNAEDKKAELLLIDKKDEDLKEVLDEEDSKSIRIEALAVAQRINDMKESMLVTDKETNELRPLQFKDIVILFRGIKSSGGEFVQVLSECGIPAYMESQAGYFDAYEIQVVLNMLRILDNPYQDIPMTVVLKSAIVGMDEEELAEIRVTDNDRSFSELVVEQMEQAGEGKLFEFNKLYKELRESVSDTPIHEVITMLLEKSGFGIYASAMPAGKRRMLNLNMLIERAIAYEKTSYKGLYHFVRYIDQLHKYEVDFGEAETVGENEDVVRIMTIHKSKGLEFPAVFVCELGRNINQRDTTDLMVLHTDLGIGINEISGSPKVKRKCLVRTEIANQIKLENLGEELRVLYVALTRAKEKLILTGCISDAVKTIQKYEGNSIDGMPISFMQRAKAACYLDWLIPALLSYPDKYDVNLLSSSELAQKEVENIAKLNLGRELIEDKIKNADSKLIEDFSNNFEFEYKYKSDMNKKSKYSVSELKHDSMVEKFDRLSGEAEIPKFATEDKESYIPSFAQEAESDITGDVNPGALRGTAVHRVMECLEFEKILDLDLSNDVQIKAFVENQKERMLDNRLITKELLELVPGYMIINFIKNPVALRMAHADSQGLLFKEKPFVMGKDDVLIQGIIDVFWIENDKIVLLDYKTDSVTKVEELITRYKTQLELYADALSRIFTRSDKVYKADESLIYSFKFKEVISV